MRELIGARGELAVFCKQLLLSAFSKSLSKTLLCADNCVMDRWSLDQLAIKVAKEMGAVREVMMDTARKQRKLTDLLDDFD